MRKGLDYGLYRMDDKAVQQWIDDDETSSVETDASQPVSEASSRSTPSLSDLYNNRPELAQSPAHGRSDNPAVSLGAPRQDVCPLEESDTDSVVSDIDDGYPAIRLSHEDDMAAATMYVPGNDCHCGHYIPPADGDDAEEAAVLEVEVEDNDRDM